MILKTISFKSRYIYASVEKFPLCVILILLLNRYDHEILNEKCMQWRACNSWTVEPTADCPEQLSSNQWCLVFRSKAHTNQSFQWSHNFSQCYSLLFTGVPLYKVPEANFYLNFVSPVSSLSLYPVHFLCVLPAPVKMWWCIPSFV